MNSSVPQGSEFTGVVNRVLLRKPDGWGILAVTEHTGVETKLVGTFLEIPVTGSAVTAGGRWVTHASFGRQFAATQMTFTVPHSTTALARYLTEAFQGIGPTTAAKIVAVFGDDTQAALGDPVRLVKVAKLRKSLANTIATQWNAREGERGVAIFLRELGLGPSHAAKAIHKFEPEHVQEILTANPYRLTEIAGIGFTTADAAAMKLGLSPTAEFRIRAGIRYALETRSGDGHTATTTATLVAVASKLLGIGTDIVAEQLDSSVLDGLLNQRESDNHGGLIYLLPHLDDREKSVARDVRRILGQTRATIVVPSIAEIETEFGFAPDASQYSAIATALTSGMLIITGGPGTGKTTLLRIILALYRRHTGKDAWVVAPTGRAAKRVKEATGEEATTAHRFLGVQPGPGGFAFKHDRANKLDIAGDLLTLEESSMFDISLTASLLAAIPDNTPVLILGDSEQLPSVGAGNVLADLIAGGVPTVRLTTIHRTDEGSMIPVTALQIREGTAPKLTNKGDVRGVSAREANAVATELQTLIATGIPFDDIGILSPMKKGPMGTDWLNIILQRELNPVNLAAGAIANGRKIDIPGGGQTNETIALGDRVMQSSKNDYDLDIYNGDLFVVTAIADPKSKARWIDLRRLDDNECVRIPSDKLFDIRLAYAMTIHKSQGSQYPHVILVLVSAHHRMLYRRLLNTGWTRSMKTLTIVGESRAIQMACDNVGGIDERQTGLADLLAA
jgi:exodeoxyribonuclease V alpha subunit